MVQQGLDNLGCCQPHIITSMRSQFPSTPLDFLQLSRPTSGYEASTVPSRRWLSSWVSATTPPSRTLTGPDGTISERRFEIPPTHPSPHLYAVMVHFKATKGKFAFSPVRSKCVCRALFPSTLSIFASFLT